MLVFLSSYTWVIFVSLLISFGGITIGLFSKRVKDLFFFLVYVTFVFISYDIVLIGDISYNLIDKRICNIIVYPFLLSPVFLLFYAIQISEFRNAGLKKALYRSFGASFICLAFVSAFYAIRLLHNINEGIYTVYDFYPEWMCRVFDVYISAVFLFIIYVVINNCRLSREKKEKTVFGLVIVLLLNLFSYIFYSVSLRGVYVSGLSVICYCLLPVLLIFIVVVKRIIVDIVILRNKVFDSALDGVMVIGPMGRVKDINVIALNILGVDKKKVINEYIGEISISDINLKKAIVSGVNKCNVFVPPGKYYLVLKSYVDSFKSNIMVVIRDITEVMNVEEQLISEKKFFSGLMNSFNNWLQESSYELKFLKSFGSFSEISHSEGVMLYGYSALRQDGKLHMLLFYSKDNNRYVSESKNKSVADYELKYDTIKRDMPYFLTADDIDDLFCDNSNIKKPVAVLNCPALVEKETRGGLLYFFYNEKMYVKKADIYILVMAANYIFYEYLNNANKILSKTALDVKKENVDEHIYSLQYITDKMQLFVKSIEGNVLEIESKTNSSNIKDDINLINKNCRILHNLLEDISILTLFRNNALKIEKGELDVGSIVSNAFDKYKKFTDIKNISYILKNNIKSDARCVSNKEALEIIFSRLIDNAVKYAVEGTVEVGITMSGGQFVFYVKDTGIGIQRKIQAQILYDFENADMDFMNIKNRLGNGLLVVQILVSLYGGRFSFKSVENRGSFFYVKLPCV